MKFLTDVVMPRLILQKTQVLLLPNPQRPTMDHPLPRRPKPRPAPDNNRNKTPLLHQIFARYYLPPCPDYFFSQTWPIAVDDAEAVDARRAP